MKENEIHLTERQIHILKHAIGYSPERIKDGRYAPYRNRYAAQTDDSDWEKLVEFGLAEKYVEKSGYVWYYDSRKGLDVLGEILGIQIEDETP